jgi:hypothetical protein
VGRADVRSCSESRSLDGLLPRDGSGISTDRSDARASFEVFVDTTITGWYGKSRDDQNQDGSRRPRPRRRTRSRSRTRGVRRSKETIMLLGRLPFDYIQYIDRGDRIRRSRGRPNGSRRRRGPRGGKDDRGVSA